MNSKELFPKTNSSSSFSRARLAHLARTSAGVVMLGGALAACSAGGGQTPAAEKIGQGSAAVINGKNSDKSQDAVVLLVHYDPRTGEFGACTGTLIAPRLVLTARHCVADTDESAACDVEGTPLAAGEIRGNHKADSLYVFTGPTRPDFRTGDVKPAGIGSKIIDDGATNLCNHDFALLVLKEPVANAQIAPIRVDSEITKGETVTAIGWGVTEDTPSPDVRQQRTGIKVAAVGPDDTEMRAVPPNEFEVGESICSGDSGGPAIAASGAIVGVVSRGGNSSRPTNQNPAANCIGGESENLYTKLSPFKDMILKGFELVEADPWYEGGEDPRLLKPGSACGEDTECRSSHCLADPSKPDERFCADDCASKECPEGQTCTTVGEAQVCRAPVAANAAAPATTTTTSGCSTSAGDLGGSSNGAIALALGALGLVVASRRSRQR